MTRSLPVIQPSSLIPEGRKPAWLKVRAPGGPNYMRLKSRMREWNLHSVCEEARCPNIGECWEDATATFMILGDVCTRNCGYCAIAHGTPVWEDREEPERIGRAVGELGLEYVVITSVNRDDLADGGAAHWAATVRAVGRHAPRCRVEVLIPDFQGRAASLETVLDARPDILNHNTETVERLYKVARHGGRYARALGIFRHARPGAPHYQDLRANAQHVRLRGARGRRAARHPQAHRAAAADAREGRAVRVRQGPDRRVRGPLRDQVFHDRHLLHPDRHRAHVRLAVGGGLSPARMVRVRGDDGVPRDPYARVPLHLAQGRTRVGLGAFFTSKLDEAIGWARKYSIFQYPFVTACCGMEYMATACSHYDIDRFGAGLPRFSPRQADVLFVVGTISHKMAPVLKRVYDQMTEPKWVVAFGVCTCTGGFYNNYATVQGIDTIIPVDIYIPGCPPRPESVIDGLMKLQDKIATSAQRF